MAELRDALKKLGGITPRLNKATDEANAVFRATEDLLTKLAIGIDAAVDVMPLRDDDVSEEEGVPPVRTSETLRLVYGRITGRMRLGFHVETIRSNPDTREDGDGVLAIEFDRLVAWDQAPREWKLTGIVKLPELISTIAESAEGMVDNAEAATIAAKKMLADLDAVTKN